MIITDASSKILIERIALHARSTTAKHICGASFHSNRDVPFIGLRTCGAVASALIENKVGQASFAAAVVAIAVQWFHARQAHGSGGVRSDETKAISTLAAAPIIDLETVAE